MTWPEAFKHVGDGVIILGIVWVCWYYRSKMDA